MGRRRLDTVRTGEGRYPTVFCSWARRPRPWGVRAPAEGGTVRAGKGIHRDDRTVVAARVSRDLIRLVDRAPGLTRREVAAIRTVREACGRLRYASAAPGWCPPGSKEARLLGD
jgi:hypothetical protein